MKLIDRVRKRVEEDREMQLHHLFFETWGEHVKPTLMINITDCSVAGAIKSEGYDNLKMAQDRYVERYKEIIEECRMKWNVAYLHLQEENKWTWAMADSNGMPILKFIEKFDSLVLAMESYAANKEEYEKRLNS